MSIYIWVALSIFSEIPKLIFALFRLWIHILCVLDFWWNIATREYSWDFDRKGEGGLWWYSKMTSSNGNIFRVTDPLCGEFTAPGEFSAQRPVTRIFDVFIDLCLNKRLSKQPWGWWFETPAWSLWRHRNACLWLECVLPKPYRVVELIVSFSSENTWMIGFVLWTNLCPIHFSSIS